MLCLKMKKERRLKDAILKMKNEGQLKNAIIKV